MDNQNIFTETRLGHLEEYCLNEVELFKLKTINKSASITATFITKFIIGTTFTLFVLAISIAGGFWLGDLIGKIYQGFLLIAGFYLILTSVLFILQQKLKNKINNSIILQIFD